MYVIYVKIPLKSYESLLLDVYFLTYKVCLINLSAALQRENVISFKVIVFSLCNWFNQYLKHNVWIFLYKDGEVVLQYVF